MIIEKLKEDLKVAMKNKDKVGKSAISLAINSINTESKAKLRILTEQEEIALIQSEIKQLDKASVDYAKGGRQDLVDEASEKIKILQGYLPKQLSKEELILEIKALLVDKEVPNIGAAMKIVRPILADKAPGKMISEAINEYIATKK